MNGDVYYEEIFLSSKKREISRTVFDFFGVCGKVGGIVSVFAMVVGALVLPYSEITYNIKAIS